MKNIQAKKAWSILEEYPGAILVDVRTPQEWLAVGFPDLKSLDPERKVLAITWSSKNIDDFCRELEEKVSNKETPLFFLCRSGVRSYHACEVAYELGYHNVTNIVDGFENLHDPDTGWRASGLPFTFDI